MAPTVPIISLKNFATNKAAIGAQLRAAAEDTG